MRTPQSFGNEGSDYPYIVLVGDAGSGKSEIATILAHPLYQDLNWAESESEANKFDIFWTYDGSMVICDTPDNHLEEDIFTGNIQLAAALAFKPVSQILIVVRARPHLDGILESVRTYSKYLLQLENFDKTMVGVILTKTDEVPDGCLDEIFNRIFDNLGIGNIVLHSEDTMQRENLLRCIRNLWVKTVDVMAMGNCTRFFALFAISENNCEARGLKNLRDTLVKNKEIVREFGRVRKEYEGKERTDLLFEFQTWMEYRAFIVCGKITNYLAEHHKNTREKNVGIFDMVGKQIRLIMYGIYLDTTACHLPRDIDVRRCPFCNEYWTNDDNMGYLICGEHVPESQLDQCDVFGTFMFRWNESNKKLIVRSSNLRKKQKNIPQFGCGRFIHWRGMPQVDLDQDLQNSLTSKSNHPHILQSKETAISSRILPMQETNKYKLTCHYVVLMGEVGVGKSSIVEKLSGTSIPTGENPMSVTREFRPYSTLGTSLIVSDTPGCNSIEDQLEHNQQIAAALNYMPVSRILVTVKADTRIANVMSVVKKFDERLMDFSDEIVGVLVTHMDRVSWESSELENKIKDDFGIECVLFSEKDTSREVLLALIKSVCIKPVAIKVDEKNFPRLFKINDKKIKIQKEISKEVSQIKEMKRQFDELMTIDESTSGNQMIKQFTYWIEKRTKEAENRIITSNKFSFQGENADAEKGYMADMSNQINSIFSGDNDKKQVELGTDCRTRYTFDWNDGKLSVKASETYPLPLTKSLKKEDREFINKMIPRLPLEICVDLDEIGKGKHLFSGNIASFGDKMFLLPRVESEDEIKAIPMKKLTSEKHRDTYDNIRQEDSMFAKLQNSWNRMKISVGKVFGNNIDEEEEKIVNQHLQLQGHLESDQGSGDQYENSRRTRGVVPWRRRRWPIFHSHRKKCVHKRNQDVVQLKENIKKEDTSPFEVNICIESTERPPKLRITIAPTNEEIKQTDRMGNMKNMGKVNLKTDSDQNPTSSNKQEASISQSSSHTYSGDMIGGCSASIKSKTSETTEQTSGTTSRTGRLSYCNYGGRYTDI